MRPGTARGKTLRIEKPNNVKIIKQNVLMMMITMKLLTKVLRVRV